MIGFKELIRRSFVLYFQSFSTAFKVIAWLLFFELLFLFLPVPESVAPLERLLINSGILAFSFLLAAWVDQLLTAIMYNFYKKQPMDLKNSAGETLKRLASYSLVLVLWTAIITIGFIFLFFPGLVFLTWYFFISPVFVIEKLHGLQVFKRSRELIHGYGLQVFGRFFLSFVLVIFIFFVFYNLAFFILTPVLNVRNATLVLGIISLVTSRLLTPLFSCIVVILYDNVKTLKEKTLI